MNVFFQIRDTGANKEILEFIEGEGNKVFISHSTEESIEILNKHEIDKAVISLLSMKDATILKYLNDYYPDVKVVIIANKEYDNIISIFQKINYSVIHEPLKLSELNVKLTNKTILQEEKIDKKVNNNQ